MQRIILNHAGRITPADHAVPGTPARANPRPTTPRATKQAAIDYSPGVPAIHSSLSHRAFLIGLAVAITGACGPSGPVHMPASSVSPMLGRSLPGFRRSTLSGDVLDTGDLRGRVVVVKFFARYCAPCQRTLPEAQKLHRDRADVVVLGLSEDEDLQAAWDQVRRYNLTFPVVWDRGNALAGRFRVTSMPIAFVADRTGTIVWVGGPEKSGHELWQAVDAARSGMAPARSGRASNSATNSAGQP